MAIDAYLFFITQDGKVLPGTSQLAAPLPNPFKRPEISPGTVPTQLASYSFDIQQTLNLGSQTSGAGAGRVTFNPLTITKNIDANSPTLFSMCCSGTTFRNVDLVLVRSGGKGPVLYAGYGFGLVAIKTIARAGGNGEDTGMETVTFEFGQLSVGFAKQLNTGEADTFHYQTWDRVKNASGPSA